MSNTNSVTDFPCETDKHQRPVRYNIACGTATEDNERRLYGTMSRRDRGRIDEYNSSLSQPIDLAATGQDRSVSQMDRGLRYGAYVEESRRQGDAEPVTHLDLGRERWCSLRMSYDERKKLATYVDPRFQSTWYRLGEGQMELDQTAMDRYEFLKGVSDRLGGSEALSHAEYSRIVQSQIDNGDAESQWLPTPSGLMEQQEDDVIAHLEGRNYLLMDYLRRLASSACDMAKDSEFSSMEACRQYRQNEDSRASRLYEEHRRHLLVLKREKREKEEEATFAAACSRFAASLNSDTGPGDAGPISTLTEDKGRKDESTSVGRRHSRPYGLSCHNESRPTSSTSFVSCVRALFTRHRN